MVEGRVSRPGIGGVQVKALGRHFIADFHGCTTDLNDPAVIIGAMERACEVSGATVVDRTGHMFSPYGVTVMFVVAESHLAVHTWPEYGYAAVDVFTCGTTVDTQAAFESLKRDLKAQHVEYKEVVRGIMSDEGLACHSLEVTMMEVPHGTISSS